jgi:hypothetical protein
MQGSIFIRHLARFALISLSGFFICSASAQNVAAPVTEKGDGMRDTTNANDQSNSAGQGMNGGLPPNVRKLGDNDLSCEQIYAETETLQKAGEEQRAAAESASQAVTDATNEMMQQAMSMRGKEGGMGMNMMSSLTGLLGMLPGSGGMAASMVGRIVNQVAAQASDTSNQSGMPDNMKKLLEKMIDIQQKMVNAEGDMYYTQARHDYLVDLFLKKDCKLSQMKAAAKD